MDFFTLGYVSFQIVVLLLVLVVLWRNKSWDIHTNTAASILTVVGVLGTFIGIYIGLQNFNPEALQNSIKDLLNGLKIAFSTSIVGIGSSLLLKGIISPLVQTLEKKEDQDPVEEVINKFVLALKDVERENNLSSKLDDLTEAIKEESETTRNVLQGMIGTVDGNPVSFGNLYTSITEGQSKTLTQLETLTETISDKHDLIIASQANEGSETRKTLANMQSELTDRQNKAFIQLRELTKTVSYEHNQLRKEFENFSKNVAESITELATKELISSLTKVIDQFNTQLSTQFGDNFKQLNEAVGKTVEWQKQYRQNMDKLADEFRLAAKSIDDSRDSLKNIADSSSTIAAKSGSIVTSSAKLEPILHTLNDQLGAFSDLRQKANDAFPIIEGRLDALTTKFSGIVQAAITESQNQSNKLTNQYNKFQQVIDGLDGFTTKIGKVTTDVSNIIEDLETSIKSQTEALKNSASYVTTMESKLDDHLTASINALGTNLASLSQKFVDDYTPLTQSLRQVLTIAEGILPNRSGN